MFRLLQFTLGICLFLGTEGVWAFETVVINESTTLAAQPLFGREDYRLSSLNPGAQAEIISISTQHQGGVALQVRAIDGANKGQVGWVYLSSDESKRTLSILDQSKKEVSLPHLPTAINATEDDGVFEHLGTAKRINNPTNDFKKAFLPATQSMSRTPVGGVFSRESDLVSVKSDKDIWEEFKAGRLKLDEVSYKGGKLFNFTDSESGRKYTAALKPEYLADLPEAIQAIVESDPECREESGQALAAAPGHRSWLPGCDVLANQVNNQSKSKLIQCLDSIKATLSEGKKLSSSDRAKVFPKFYSKLNSHEQEFMAHIVTSIGEAGVLAPPIEEMVAIMMILENRKDYAREKGYPTANVLDAALQPSQFSMYNRGAHHWNDALNRANSDQQTQYALDAFIKLKQTKFTPEQKRIYHYHTDKVSPPWKTPRNLLKVVLNGVELKQKGPRHLYYKDIGWSFRHNGWSKK